MTVAELPTKPLTCESFIAGEPRAGSGAAFSVESPSYGREIAQARHCTPEEAQEAVEAAHGAWPAWKALPLRDRIERLLAFRALLLSGIDELSSVVSLESGKTPGEAKAGILRGIEIIDFAASLSNSDGGAALDVSRGVSCEYRRRSLGVAVGITPFNFPAMVPLWMIPIALTVGNTFVLKPSDKVPISAYRLADLAKRAGYPAGVLSVLQGGGEVASSLIDCDRVKAVGFVGSSPVAAGVYAKAAARGKRALCLGGAKNQMIVAPDADPRLTVQAIVDSFTGCAGQRCMAGSLLVLIGAGEPLLAGIVERARSLRLGGQMGALIDGAAKQRLHRAIEDAERQGARILLDGRDPAVPAPFAGGHWLGPTILDEVRSDMGCATQELFGPVLSVVRVPTLQAALELDESSPFGNATSVFTTSGAVARAVGERSTSGMIGVNVGVPVPRDPFSFGGTKGSRFGHGDITGPSGVDFWSDLHKITTKWALQQDATWMS